MSSRPLDELKRDALKRDALKVISSGQATLVITREELRMLKDYKMLVGTDNPDKAWVGGWGVYVVVREEGK